ncbi:MAG: hypothetical protein VB089_10980 [Anaerolineaceae bacterium]|nr:hypothetical protein [Anaerolineaceae bacterium]
MFVKRIAGVLCLVALAGCQAVPASPTPGLPPDLWQVQITPSLQWLATDLNNCTRQVSNVSLLIFERPTSALETEKFDFTLRWGSVPDGGPYAAVLGQDELVVIVQAHNPVEELNLAALQQIYTTPGLDWSSATSGQAPEVQAIHAWGYTAGSDVQPVFENLLLQEPANEALLYTAPDPAALRQAVADDPGAIGFIPRRWLDERVKAVSINDLPEGATQQPVLVMASQEPTGPQTTWLVCIQDALASRP